MAQSQGHICLCLGRILALRRDSPVVIDGCNRRTGGEFVDGVLSLACGLVKSGVRRGDVVAIAALNSDRYIELLLAVTYVGGIAAPLNYRWTLKEARSAMELVRPMMLVVDEGCSSWALELQSSNTLPFLKLYVLIGDSSPSLCSNKSFLFMDSMKMPSQGIATRNAIWATKEVAIICFTSGTTGQPKGVAISHTALIVQSLAKIAVVGYREDDVYLHTLPLCHIGGISSCIAMLMAGGCHVLIPKFDAKSCFQAIEQLHVTCFITVPAMIADLISYGRKANAWNSGENVTKILNGCGGLSEDLKKGASDLFPRAKIISAYGMTETCSSLTFLSLHDPSLQKSGKLLPDEHKVELGLRCHEWNGVCVGKPAPHVELRIGMTETCRETSHEWNVDRDSGAPSIGRILTRGLHLMVGYWDQSQVMMLDSTEHGWLDTGDIGWIDCNGYLWLIGREKDWIKSGGENVDPEEIEALLLQHPGVHGAAVVGIPDFRLTEKVVACVAIRDDWEWVDQKVKCLPEKKKISTDTLHDYCIKGNLSRYSSFTNYILKLNETCDSKFNGYTSFR